MVLVDVANRQALHPIDEERLRAAVQTVLNGESIAAGTISVAVVDDAEIHRLNRDYLNHDYATDVLSFCLEQGPGRVEGEIIASAETAAAAASRYGWSTAAELLLYVIHGALHLAGYDDSTPEDASRMRARERHYLAHFGLTPH